jgi:hypothetical protein
LSLSDVIQRYEVAAFEWRASDCLRFALEAARAAGGRDLLMIVPRYKNAVGALRCLRNRGFRTLAQAMDAHAAPIAAAMARPGDVAWYDDGGMGCLGVVVGSDALFLSIDGGLTARPILSCRAWRL